MTDELTRASCEADAHPPHHDTDDGYRTCRCQQVVGNNHFWRERENLHSTIYSLDSKRWDQTNQINDLAETIGELEEENRSLHDQNDGLRHNLYIYERLRNHHNPHRRHNRLRPRNGMNCATAAKHVRRLTLIILGYTLGIVTSNHTDLTRPLQSAALWILIATTLTGISTYTLLRRTPKRNEPDLHVQNRTRRP